MTQDYGFLKNIKLVCLDMDGTIYLDNDLFDGTLDFLAHVKKIGGRYIFLTNNSSKNAESYVKKLEKMGLCVDADKIVTSGQATIDYLKTNFPGKRVYLLGNELLQEEFEKEGILLAQGDQDVPEVVVTAFDTSLTYAKMCRVCDLVREGLPYITTHPDFNCPTETGFIPDSGAIHAFIHASAFRYPDRIIGKPNVDIVNYLMKRVGAEKEQIEDFYAHGVAGFVPGQVGGAVLDGAQHFFLRLAYRYAANGVAVEIHGGQFLGAGAAQVGIHGALHDAEVVLQPRAAHGLVLIHPGFAALGPAQGEPQGFFGILAVAGVGRAFIEEHGDIAAQVGLDFHAALRAQHHV